MARDERPIGSVSGRVWALLLIALILQMTWQWSQPRPVAAAAALDAPAPVSALKLSSFGEPVVLAQLMTLYLQAFDNQPGISIPFRDLDYQKVILWLETILALDPAGQYPLLLAAQVYSQVPDQARERQMLDFVRLEFLRAPNARWRWLAHATIMAKHRLHDDALALQYARDIAKYAPEAPSWARQMQIFILEDIGEIEAARILLGGLLEGKQIKDEREIHFLMERLESMKNVENSTPMTKK